jgi:cation diffusion facilitator CzcD-associated flavoprotein CzcO
MHRFSFSESSVDTVATVLHNHHFNLRPHIHFNTSVISAEYTFHRLAKKVHMERLCRLGTTNSTGHLSLPSMPGLSTWIASGKSPRPVTYRNPQVLVIGGGPSGQNIVQVADLLSSVK